MKYAVEWRRKGFYITFNKTNVIFTRRATRGRCIRIVEVCRNSVTERARSLSLSSLTNAPNHQHRITHIICVLCSLNMPRVICTARLYFLCNNGIRHKALSDQHTHIHTHRKHAILACPCMCAISRLC